MVLLFSLYRTLSSRNPLVAMGSKTFKLNNGHNIPLIGLGTYQLKGREGAEAVTAAINAGCRHFDCAWFYANELEIGKAVRAKINDGTVKREELFITTKLWNNFHEKKLVVPKLKESLEALQLDYVDLFLVHWPMGFKENADLWPMDDTNAYSDIDYLETWQAMEDCVTTGLTKSIGVSNFNSVQIDRLLQSCKIQPVVNQVEVNVKINQKKLIKYCKEKDILIIGYCPLSKGRDVLADPKIVAIAKKYKKNSAQVILNYLLSLGIAVIPKSTNPSRIASNIDVFDFKLDSDDLNYLDSLNDNTRIVAIQFYGTHKYFPFDVEF